MMRNTSTVVRRVGFQFLFLLSFVCALVLLVMVKERISAITLEKETPDELSAEIYRSNSSTTTAAPTSGRTYTRTTKHDINIKNNKTKNNESPATEHRAHRPDCGENNGTYCDMMIIIYSRAENFAARNAIRVTWMKNFQERGDLIYFLVGTTDNQTLNDSIDSEAIHYNDIWHVNSDENDEIELTLDMHEFIYQNCKKIKFVFKTVDDAFINPAKISMFTMKPGFLVSGQLIRNWRPANELRPYLPERILKTKKFDSFLEGLSYFFAGKTSELIYHGILRENYSEYSLIPDVLLNGIVLTNSNIVKDDFKHVFIPNSVPVDSCSYHKHMISHGHSPDDILRLWYDVYHIDCYEPTRPTKKPTEKTKAPEFERIYFPKTLYNSMNKFQN